MGCSDAMSANRLAFTLIYTHQRTHINPRSIMAADAADAARPPAPAPDCDDDDGGLGALGFMFDGEAPKSWRELAIPSTKVVVEVRCIDDDGPGALQSGHYVWPAAPVLAGFVARQWGLHATLKLPPQARILELGSGCGLVGLTVAQMDGCAHVVMTDHDPGAIKLIEDGVARNGGRLAAECKAGLLEWGDAGAAVALAKEGFDLVIASDVIYSIDVVRPLMATVTAVLKGEETTAARFLMCGSFALGDLILAEMERVCKEMNLVRTPVSWNEEWKGAETPASASDVWMECLTLTGGEQTET